MEKVKDTVFEHRSINELLDVVRNDFHAFEDQGFIDAGRLVKTVLYCNERLGLPIRQVREVALRVDNYRAELPIDFEKLYYVAALNCTNAGEFTQVNPFDNNVDTDVIYKACLDRESIGCVDNYKVVIERKGVTIPFHYHSWSQLSIGNRSFAKCHLDCPNKSRVGKYEVQIEDDHIATPFRSGILYIMYVGSMTDEEGNVTFPFHPLVTPYYEWSIKEKILSDMIFNSEKANISDMYKLAQQERVKAWLDAYNFTSAKEFDHYVKLQRKKELQWYSQYFRLFK